MTPSRSPKKARSGAAARRATVSSVSESSASAATAAVKDETGPYNPYAPKERPLHHSRPSTAEELHYHSHSQSQPSEEYLPYRPTSFDRGDRYSSSELLQAGQPELRQDFQYPLTPVGPVGAGGYGPVQRPHKDAPSR